MKKLYVDQNLILYGGAVGYPPPLLSNGPAVYIYSISLILEVIYLRNKSLAQASLECKFCRIIHFKDLHNHSIRIGTLQDSYKLFDYKFFMCSWPRFQKTNIFVVLLYMSIHEKLAIIDILCCESVDTIINVLCCESVDTIINILCCESVDTIINISCCESVDTIFIAI